MKRKKKYIYLLIIIPILIWFFSGFVNIETKDIPIKKIIKTNTNIIGQKLGALQRFVSKIVHCGIPTIHLE